MRCYRVPFAILLLASCAVSERLGSHASANDTFVPYGAWRGHIRSVQGPFRTKEKIHWGNGITPVGGAVLMHVATVAGQAYSGSKDVPEEGSFKSAAKVKLSEFTALRDNSVAVHRFVLEDVARAVLAYRNAEAETKAALSELAAVAQKNAELATRISQEAGNQEMQLAKNSKEKWTKAASLLKAGLKLDAVSPPTYPYSTLKDGFAAWSYVEGLVGNGLAKAKWLAESPIDEKSLPSKDVYPQRDEVLAVLQRVGSEEFKRQYETWMNVTGEEQGTDSLGLDALDPNR